jgi:phospholipid transport system substrate-binding protein
MRKVFTNMVFIYALIVAIWANVSLAANTDGAMALVKETTGKVLKVLTDEKDKLKSDPSHVYQLADQIVLQHFDFERISKYAVGKNWKEMNADQQTRFIKEFRDMLVRTYATALIAVSEDKVEVEYLPLRTEEGDKKVTVQTIAKYEGKKVSIDYKIYFNSQKWQVYDVIAEGVSLVTNYRTEFNTDIQKIGVDALIQKIADGNAKARQGGK